MRHTLPRWYPRFATLMMLSAICPSPASADPALAPDAQAMALTCATCHWIEEDGPAVDGGIPSLGRRSSAELLQKLREYRADRGDPTIMNRIAKGFTDEQLARIAEYIAASAAAAGMKP